MSAPNLHNRHEIIAAATKQFVHWFIQSYGAQDSWAQAGYNLEIGYT
jgi:hypothetical protein